MSVSWAGYYRLKGDVPSARSLARVSLRIGCVGQSPVDAGEEGLAAHVHDLVFQHPDSGGCALAGEPTSRGTPDLSVNVVIPVRVW